MFFSTDKRVDFGKNPLVRVRCQLQFPPILAINETYPAAFQSAIRDRFPNYSLEAGYADDMPNGEGIATLPDDLAEWQFVTHEFANEDENVSVDLAASFVSISTYDYTRWEVFRRDIMDAVQALIDKYHPATFSRVDLRYTDMVSRKELGLEGKPWRELFKSEMLGVLSTDTIPESSIGATMQNAYLSFDEQVSMKLTAGQSVSEDAEPIFIVDTDYFTREPVQAEEPPLDLLDKMHRIVSGFFQWTLQDELYQAMKPEVIGSYDV